MISIFFFELLSICQEFDDIIEKMYISSSFHR